MSNQQEITIQTTGGPRVVEAFVFGAWAAHRKWNQRGWAVTHVRSGLCVPDGYLDSEPKYVAIRVAKALDLKFGDVEPSKEVGKLMSKEVWRVVLGVEA